MKTARDIAERELGRPVTLSRSTRVGSTELTLWSGMHMRPSPSVAVCATEDKCYVASKDEESMRQCLRDLMHRVDDVKGMVKVVRATYPSRTLLLSEEDPSFIKEKTGDRPGPFVVDGVFTCYVNDFARGRVVRVTVDSTHTLELHDVGAGLDSICLFDEE